MSARDVIVLESRDGTVRIEASPNGRMQCPVLFFERDVEDPQHVDDINVTKEPHRARYLADLPEKHRANVRELLLGIAYELERRMRASASTAAAAAPASPFPVVEPWDEPVDGAELLDAITDHVLSFVALGPAEATAIALWVVHTYAIGAADFTPYLWVHSATRECGKSTLLDVLERLAWKAMRSDRMSAAALFRRIDRLTPTLLLDELDALLAIQDNAESLRGVLNSGYARGGRVTVCVGDAHEDRDFRTFAPKVLAGIGKLWDTVVSRSILIRLERATDRQLSVLKKARADVLECESADLRRQCLRWAIDHEASLKAARPEVPRELGARQSDVWAPLLAIAEAARDVHAREARGSALQLQRSAEDEGDLGVMLLHDVRSILDVTGRSKIKTVDLLEQLRELEGRPWGEFRRGQPLTPRGLADLMRRFKVRPKTHRDNELVFKGYERKDLELHFKRYLAPTSKERDIEASDRAL